jgi:hypothetical protein
MAICPVIGYFATTESDRKWRIHNLGNQAGCREF